VSPLTDVRKGWEETATKFSVPADDDLTDLDSAEKRCLTLTYAGTGDVAIMAIRKCKRPIILVLDEFHRIEETDEAVPANGWGKHIAALQGLSSVKHTFCLTATPWREGPASLPFVKYDANDEVIADFTWAYPDELGSDPSGVVAVAFKDYDAECDYRNGEKKGTHSTKAMKDYDPHNPFIPFGMAGFVRARQYHELLARPVMVQMLRDASVELFNKRKSYGKIKGLIVCESIDTAKVVDEFVRHELQKTCTLITSKQKNASKLVDTFRADDTEWCVSVGMLAEGVDVKAIKVVVDFSNVLTLRDIIQRWGRALRALPGSKTTATVFFINHSMLRYVAEMLTRQINQAKKDKEKKEGGGGDKNKSETIYSNHSGQREGSILDGKSYDINVSELADWIVSVQYRDISDYASALVIADLIYTGYLAGANPLPPGYLDGWQTTEEEPTYSLRQKKQDQRSEATEFVGVLAGRWFPDLSDRGEAHTRVNREIKTRLLRAGYEHGTGEYNRARYDLLKQYAEQHA